VRVPGRERASSRRGKLTCPSFSLVIDEPRGRSSTEIFQYEESEIAEPCYTRLESSYIVDDACAEIMVGEDAEHFQAGASWDECASDFIDVLLAGAVEDYSDEAVSWLEDANGDVFTSLDLVEQHATDNVLAYQPCSRISACDTEDADSNYDANSDCHEYLDSELSEEEAICHGSQRSHAELALGQGIFSNYVSDMFEMAFSGNVSDFFGGVGQAQLSVECCTHTAEQIPPPKSLQPCSRPSLRRRLRPREIQQSEIFAMDCLPSKFVCSQALEKRPVEFWAEQLKRAAVAEDVFNEAMALSSFFEVQTKDKLEEPSGCSGIATLPVAPSAPKPSSLRPNAFQRSYQQTQHQTSLLATALPPNTHRVPFARVDVRGPLPLQADIGSTPIQNLETHSPRLPISQLVVVPPQGPPPHARMSSLHQQKSPHMISFDVPSKLSELKGSELTKNCFLLSRSVGESGCKDAAAASSAISLDLGDEANTISWRSHTQSDKASEHHTRSVYSNARVSKSNNYEYAAKSRWFLPPLSARSSEGFEADTRSHSLSWKSHDVM